MKRLLMPFVMALMLTGCSTYQYSSRSIDVRNRNVGAKETAVEVVVDYARVVTSTSDFQLTKNDAIKEAEYRCLIDNKIDVIVDPIVKVEFSPFSISKKYRATITGYAGMYKVAPAGVDIVKSYSKEEIEKYKLLTDPSFPQHYYNSGEGDNYYINSSTGQTVKSGISGVFGSLAAAPKLKSPKQPKTFDFSKAKKLRNVGATMTAAGVVSILAIGLPCMTTAEQYDEFSGYYDYTYFNESQYNAGIAFTVLGVTSIVAGLPMWCVGSHRMKKSGNTTSVSVGGTKKGLGLRLNF
ncbi:MAG: hypothetical protein E7111_06305 [Bacteroidales bacterium]|nr:hypothetical protein [Bacteroidales bacterium]